MEDNTSQSTESEQNKLSKYAIYQLGEIGKWTKFLAIIGFIFIGLMVVLGFYMGSFMSKINPAVPYPSYMFTFIYLVLGLIYFFPILYLFKFSMHLKRSLSAKDPSQLDSAFSNLNAHYKYVGILAIIVLAIYGLFGVIMILFGMFNGFPSGSYT